VSPENKEENRNSFDNSIGLKQLEKNIDKERIRDKILNVEFNVIVWQAKKKKTAKQRQSLTRKMHWMGINK